MLSWRGWSCRSVSPSPTSLELVDGQGRDAALKLCEVHALTLPAPVLGGPVTDGHLADRGIRALGFDSPGDLPPEKGGEGLESL